MARRAARRFARRPRRSLVVILGTSGVVFALALLNVFTAPKEYVTTATIYVAGSTTDTDTEFVLTEAADRSDFSREQIDSFRLLMTSVATLNTVAERLELTETGRDLTSHLFVATDEDAATLTITAVDSDPVRAAMLANTLTEVSADTIEDYSRQSSRAPSLVEVQTINPAAVPAAPIAPSLAYNVAVAIILGPALGGVLLLIRRGLRPPLKQRDDLALAVPPGVPVFTTLDDRGGPELLARELLRHTEGRVRFIAVIGASAHLALTDILDPLCLAIGQLGQTAMLVDGDLRSTLNEPVQSSRHRGVIEALRDLVDPNDAVDTTSHPYLFVHAGRRRLRPTAGLDTARFAGLLQSWSSQADLVFVALPPANTVDTLILAQACDGAVVLADTHSTRRPDVQRTLRALARGHIPVIGVTLADSEALAWLEVAPTTMGWGPPT